MSFERDGGLEIWTTSRTSGRRPHIRPCDSQGRARGSTTRGWAATPAAAALDGGRAGVVREPPRDGEAVDRGVLLYRGPGGLPRLRSCARPADLTFELARDQEARKASSGPFSLVPRRTTNVHGPGVIMHMRGRSVKPKAVDRG